MNEEAYVEAEAKALNALSDFIGGQVRQLCEAAGVAWERELSSAMAIEERYLSAIAEGYRDATRGWDRRGH